MFNQLLDTDSYKNSHPWQDPPGLRKKVYYLEAREGGEYDYTVFFGLQPKLRRLAQGFTQSDIAEAASLMKAHGVPFPSAEFGRILQLHRGRFPLRIWAVPEGTPIRTGNILMRVENTDPAVPWLGGFFETMLMRVWYPTTVATKSHRVRAFLERAVRRTCDTMDCLPFRLHDFGARGVSSYESAALGGAGHLVSFHGTDTVAALELCRQEYGCPCAGYSIPAAEHSTILPWGKDGERACFENALNQFARPGTLVAQVSDTYDLEHAVKEIWGKQLKEKVIQSGATVVIRPDSGDPVKIVRQVLSWLGDAYGWTVNSKGYKVLKHVRVIQGDGVTEETIREITINSVVGQGWAMENVAFGMGGGLLQLVNRDTARFAYKCCYVEGEDGVGHGVCKTPATDFSKTSKAGYLDLTRTNDGNFVTAATPDGKPSPASRLELVFDDGDLVSTTTLAEIRIRAEDVVR